MNIIINGRNFPWAGATIKYENICVLIGQNSPTITWRANDGEHGGLIPGQFVPISEGMMFTAVNTGNA